MGLLDDAIREHLELKRLRGADPSEIARAERDALGPVRRAVDPPGEAGPEGAQELAPEPDGPLDEVGEAYPEGDIAAHHVESGAAAAPIPPTEEHEELLASTPGSETGEDDADEWLSHEPPEPEPPALHQAPAAPPASDEYATQVYQPPAEEGVPPSAPAPAPVRPMSGDVAEHPADADADADAGHEPALPPEEPPATGPVSGDQPSEPAPERTEGEHDEDVLEETPDFLQETPEHDRLWFEQRPPRDFDFDK